MDVSSVETAEPASAGDIVARLRAEQNFALAVPAGLAAAVVGALLWAAVVYLSHMEIGLIAVALGALVGYAVKLAGSGIELRFGILGAVCAALGWGLGTTLGDVAFLANARNMPLLDVLQRLDLHGLGTLFTLAFEPLDLLFLGIAVYEGYKFSFRLRIAQ